MKQTKPLSTIRQKCEECKGTGSFEYGFDDIPGTTTIDCIECKSTGQQKAEITPLRDFEKCQECNHDRTGFFNDWDKTIKKTAFPKLCECKGTGYKIPFKDYEIKKVSEITDEEAKILSPKYIILDFYPDITYQQFFRILMKEYYNLKEDDNVVVRVR